MKHFLPLLFILISSCSNGSEGGIIYTGSTPADKVVRNFLGISLTDSIDFIRWKLSLDGDSYTVSCNYGIGKPNTNGFINGGKLVEIKGQLKKEGSYYFLQNNDKKLAMAELNSDLLHLLDADKNLLVGTAGWSYTLGNEKPINTDHFSIASKKIILKDSIAFHGRTPCIEYEEIKRRSDCYKLKWSIVLYADKTNNPAIYSLRGTVNEHKTKTGTWTMTTGKDGRTIIHLLSENKESLYFLMPDENILLFTDADGKLLVGDKDFSYTLNRRL